MPADAVFPLRRAVESQLRLAVPRAGGDEETAPSPLTIGCRDVFEFLPMRGIRFKPNSADGLAGGGVRGTESGAEMGFEFVRRVLSGLEELADLHAEVRADIKIDVLAGIVNPKR